jgi:hypothetical protein
MATVIGLGVQFSANANGMTKGLSQVDRQLQNLGKQAAAAGSLFSSFTASSAAAGAAEPVGYQPATATQAARCPQAR